MSCISPSNLNVNLTALCKEGRLKEALHILLTKHNPPVDSSTYIHLLQACTAKKALSEGKQIHSHLNDRGLIFTKHTFFQNKLINMYDKCGSLVDARNVFDNMTEPNIFSWNMIISAYRRHELPHEVFTLFHQMQRTGVQLDQFTFSSIIPVCANVASLNHGLQVHGKIIRCGFPSDVTVMNTLIDMYAKCGRIQKARELFDKMHNKDVVSWNAMITGYVHSGALEEALRLFEQIPQQNVVSWNALIVGYAQNGHVEKAMEFFRQMQLAGVTPNSTTFVSIIPACAKMGTLEQGLDIHQEIIDSGFLSDIVVVTALVDMYAKCGSIQKAHELFDKMPERNVISWTAIVAGYAQKGLVEKALDIFKQMQLAGVEPNSTTFASILPACGKMGFLEQGMELHLKIMEGGILSDVVLATALIDMYAKCGNIQKACQLFDKMNFPSVISWNAMIAGYAQNGLADKALELYKKMQLAGIKPDSSTFATILPSCAKLGVLEQGMEIHQKTIELGFLSDVVMTALIDMYGKCGNIQKARELFDKMPQRDVAAWNAILVGYTQSGVVDKAMEIFNKMQLSGVKSDSSTFAGILPACAKHGALEKGMAIHQKIIKCGFLLDVVAVTALIDMYAKCGSIQKACELFDKMYHPGIVSWNAMIAGYAMHGYSKDALEFFELMKLSGTNPDLVSFVCVLFACSHAGLVDNGCKYFNCMSKSYCIMPAMDHYVCMVDLLGRAGYLQETLNFIVKMPIKPDMLVWTCLLGACRSHKNIGLGEFVARFLLELNPKNAAPYVLLSNIYAEVGRWGDVQKVRKLMKDREIKKTPGCSWIEVHKVAHAFCVGDRSHPQTQDIYAELEKLSREMKAAGYIPDNKFVLNDVEEEEKELVLSHHSEKLAIAFGLLNTSPGTTIRVVKNLRVCGECHTATKFISKIVEREIVVRDANRFHHFKQGECSCGDYW